MLLTACTAYAPVLPKPDSPATSNRRADNDTDDRDPPHPEAQARQLYRLAEARYAEGDPAGAASLLEQSIAASPDDVDPTLRHQLEARLTFLQLTAWTSSGDLEFVLAARQRLFTRLAAFAEQAPSLAPEQADAMRRDLFEQLADVEAQLQAALGEAPESSDAELALMSAAADARGRDAARKPDDAAEVTSTSRRRRDADGNEIREIDVHSRNEQRLEDPEVQQRAFGNFGRPGRMLTRATIDVVHGPRGLVRVIDARDGEGMGARTRLRRWVRLRRDALTACYGEAFARNPIFGLQVQVAWTSTDGRAVDPTITEGTLIDAKGDRCLLEALAEPASNGDEPLREGDTMVRLVFFFEDTVLMVGDTGEFLAPGQSPTKPTDAGPTMFDMPAPVR